MDHGLIYRQPPLHFASDLPGLGACPTPKRAGTRHLLNGLLPATENFTSQSLYPLASMEQLALCLPDTLLQDTISSSLLSHRASVQLQVFESPVYRLLIISVENNFAGLDGFSKADVIELLKRDRSMRSRLIKYLEQAPRTVSTALVEKLIVGAIEAQDAATVKELLSTNLVDADNIVCEVDGDLYTGIERATALWNIDLIETLVAAGASVNKTAADSSPLQIALEQIRSERLGGSQDSIETHIDVIEALLCNGARVVARHVRLAIISQNRDLLTRVIAHFCPSTDDHAQAFAYDHSDRYSIFDLDHGLLLLSSKRCDEDLAIEITKILCFLCSQANCGRCIEPGSKALERAITVAAARGFQNLLQLLLCYSSPGKGALAGAVRGCSQEIIWQFLRTGAVIDSDPEVLCLKDVDGLHEEETPRTPLAEAIRRQDKDLIAYFESHGALDQIEDPKRFVAALCAASEVGDIAYVRKLLRLAPSQPEYSLNWGLAISVENSHQEVSKTLLEAGAYGTTVQYERTMSLLRRSCFHPVVQALRQRNKALVLDLLECDSDYGSLPQHKLIIDESVLWGDLSVIEDIWMLLGHSSFASLELIAGMFIEAAFSDNNLAMFTFFAEKLKMPMLESLRNVWGSIINMETVRHLLSLGADPYYALASSGFDSGYVQGHIVRVLLREFHDRYPMDKRNIGSQVLLVAIRLEDDELLDLALEANSDLLSLLPADDRKPDEEQHTIIGAAITLLGDRRVDIVRKLMVAGVDPNGIVWTQNDVINLQSSEGVVHFHRPRLQQTALIRAIHTQNEVIVRYLVENGADIHRAARMTLKRTPLQQACEAGSMNMVEFLLQHGARVNEKPAFRGGGTSLQLCAISGHVGIARLLIRHGADIHAAPAVSHGRTALEGAAEHGRLDMLKVLWDASPRGKFAPEDYERAMKLARKGGHEACRTLLEELSLAENCFVDQGTGQSSET